MSTGEPLLDLPASIAVRRRALDLLDAAESAAARLGGKHPEALHDFRVAVRRLRTMLRAYAAHERVPKRLSKRLRKLAHATNRARDLEVVVTQLRRLAKEGRTLARRLAHDATVERDAARSEALAALRAAWPKLARRLRGVFETADTPGDGASFGMVSAHLAGEQWEELQQLLAALRFAWREEAVHQARLTGKRLRYLLEPVTEELATPDALAAMKTFQECVGAYHDGWVLLQTIADTAAQEAAAAARAQLLAGGDTPFRLGPYRALRDRVQRERDALAAQIQRDYLAPGAAALAPVAAAVVILAQRAATPADLPSMVVDEAVEPLT